VKKNLSVLFIIVSISIGYTQGFTVNNYTVDIYINQKGYFEVVENYDLNFEKSKHGIYRTIQTDYDLLNFKGQKEKRKIKISNIKVPGYKFDAPFKFAQKFSDEINIKIGDKDITLIGPQHYEIKYRVQNAFLFEDSAIRFYWNIKPDGWIADFHRVNFRVHVPENIQLSNENCFVYSGDRGTTAVSSDIEVQYENGVFHGSSIENFISRPGQSVTILMNLPVNSIKEIKPLWPFWNQYGWIFIIVVLIGGFYTVWKKYGKDDRVVSTTSYYPPDNIDPAMAGFLINDSEDSSDLIALLPYWGSKGFLKIEEIPKKGLFSSGDTKLIRIKTLPIDAPVYEHEIFNGLFESENKVELGDFFQLSKKGKTLDFVSKIFGVDKNEVKPGEVLVSSLKNTFYKTMNSAQSKLKDEAQPYYEARSKKVRNITWGVLIPSTILLSATGLFFWGPIAAVFIFITCVVLLILNITMIKKNAIGNRLFSELKGFKRFIKMAEENKLKMLLKDDPGYFETTMGYALTFGLFEKWARKFDALNLEPPSWYASGTPHNLSMHNFSKSFSSAMSGVKSNMVSSPSSSGGSGGGGSSGGGFGGGGGGSW